MKKISFLLAIIVLLSVALLPGCEYKDINRRIFIVELGIDSTEVPGYFSISAKAAIPSASTSAGSGQQRINYEVYTMEASSIGEALRKLKIQTSLEPDYGHMKNIVVGKDFAEEYPLDTVLDYFLRRRDMQNIAYFCIGMPKAIEVLKAQSPDTNVPGSEIFFKFGEAVRSPYADKTRVFEIYRSTINKGESPYCPIVEVKNNKINVAQVAVFSQDNKLQYQLAPEETKIFKILNNTTNNAYITVSTKEDPHPLGINIEKSITQIKFKTNPDKSISCDLNVNVTAMLEETPHAHIDVVTIKDLFEQELNRRIDDFINRLKSEKIDPLLLVVRYWSVTPSYEPTDEWFEKILPNIKFNINTHVKILNTGTLR